jgi:FkbM family methyltransferase
MKAISGATQVFGWAIGRPLPEGNFKEVLRKQYYSRCNPAVHSLNSRIRKAGLVEEGILLVELDNGMKLHGSKDKTERRWMKYGDQQKLSKMKDYPSFGSFFEILYEVVYLSVYERGYRLKRGDTVVDIGAHVGTFAVKAAHAIGNEGRVIAIEPEPNNFALLLRNIETNGLTNVVAVRKAGWSTKGKSKLHLASHQGADSLRADTFYRTKDRDKSITVEVDTVDNMLRESGLPQVNFIKMDIEGSELEALKGMDRILRTDVKLAIAAYHVVNGEPTYKTIVPQLARRGFEVSLYKREIVYANKER